MPPVIEDESDIDASSPVGSDISSAGEDDDFDNIDEEELDDNYKLEDLDEFDEDLELRDDEPRSSPKKDDKRREAPVRETRKRQLTFYEEDEEAPKAPVKRERPASLDEELMLTDEETEYNPKENPDLSKMTERQRARFLEDEQGKKFVELDANKPKKPKKNAKGETEQEAAVRKAENARRRLDYKNKQLEEEKRDTLNKLLKRRATKTREVQTDGNDAPKLTVKPRRPYLQHPGLLVYVSRADAEHLSYV